MIGTKVYKADFDYSKYRQMADWCESTQMGIIRETTDYYECVEAEKHIDYEQEAIDLKQYLSDTDGIYFKCQEEGLDVNVKYAEVIEKRKKARARINEIESITGVTYGNFK